MLSWRVDRRPEIPAMLQQSCFFGVVSIWHVRVVEESSNHVLSYNAQEKQRKRREKTERKLIDLMEAPLRQD